MSDNVGLRQGGKGVEQGPKDEIKNSSNDFTQQFIRVASHGPLAMD